MTILGQISTSAHQIPKIGHQSLAKIHIFVRCCHIVLYFKARHGLVLLLNRLNGDKSVIDAFVVLLVLGLVDVG